MGMDVDGLDPLAVDHDLAPPTLPRRWGGTAEAASDKCKSRERAGDQFP